MCIRDRYYCYNEQKCTQNDDNVLLGMSRLAVCSFVRIDHQSLAQKLDSCRYESKDFSGTRDPFFPSHPPKKPFFPTIIFGLVGMVSYSFSYFEKREHSKLSKAFLQNDAITLAAKGEIIATNIFVIFFALGSVREPWKKDRLVRAALSCHTHQ